MSLQNNFYSVLEDFLPFVHDDFLHKLILSGNLPEAPIINNEKFNTNILSLEKYLTEENSINNNDNIKVIEKEWKNNNGEYIIENKKNVNNIIFISNNPLKKYYELANHLSLFFNIYGINNRIPLSLNKIIQNKNFSLLTTSPKIILDNLEIANYSQSFVTISKENENLSKNQILNLSILTKPWYLLNLNNNNIKILKEIYDKSKSRNKVFINCINNTKESENSIEKIYLNDIIYWLNTLKKSLI